MPPALKYMAENFVGTELYVSLVWDILVTERVALLSVKWYRQLYTQYNMWHINRLLYEQIRQMVDSLERVLGKKRNALKIFALMDWARGL